MLEILSVILDNLTVGIVVLDKNLTIKYANNYFKNIIKEKIESKIEENNFGNIFQCKNSSEVVMCGTSKSCGECDINRLLKSIIQDKKECVFEIETVIEKFNFAREETYEFRGSPLTLDGEEYIKLELHEITEKKNLEKSIENKIKMEHQLFSFFNAMEDLIFYMDSDGRVKYCNKAYANFLEKPYEEILGKKESELFPIEMVEKCNLNTVEALEKGSFLDEEELMGKWFQTFKCRIEVEETKEIGVLGVVRDISSQKKRELELKDLAYLDLLTGLFNRNFYESKIYEIMKENKRKVCSVLLIDVDNFKEINDSLGHEVGDRCLKNIAEIVLRNTRKEDYPIRIGGDELFVITFSNENPTNIIGKRILEEIRELEYSGKKVSVSIGTGTQSKKREGIEELYKKADIALYKAKLKGKNRMEKNEQ